jgi:hypothetical protein
MGTKVERIERDVESSVNEALDELEKVSDEIRLKLHLAGMDARDRWNKDLAPRLENARAHAKEARSASKKAIEDTLEALRSFAASL